ncbi:hypothetical protein VLK31_26950 [Variovorax sp. H27-G14]|uniref:hypothetical protein n=1 Tax=Variovorax sp. H27-G14 TaxID=3111914 RepID=UPI0038FC9DA4
MLTRLSRCVAVTLLLAVWLASTLGLVHATLHVPGDPARALVAARAVSAMAAPAQAEAQVRAFAPRHLWVPALFGDKTDAECRLYDQLAHGASAPGVPLVVLPMLLPAATFAFLEGEAVARWVALFEARGPPSIR